VSESDTGPAPATALPATDPPRRRDPVRWVVWPLVAVLVGGLAVQQFGADARGAVSDWREERRWKQEMAAGERAVDAFAGFRAPSGFAVQPASNCQDVLGGWCATARSAPADALAAVTPALAAVGITTVDVDGACALSVRGDDGCRQLDLRHDGRIVGMVTVTRHEQAAQAWGEPTWVQVILGYASVPETVPAPIRSAADVFAEVAPPGWDLGPLCTPGTPPSGHRTCETAEAAGTVRGDPRAIWAEFGARTLAADIRTKTASCGDPGPVCRVFAARSPHHTRLETVSLFVEPAGRGRTKVELSVDST
jgi:hypothetical protein